MRPRRVDIRRGLRFGLVLLLTLNACDQQANPPANTAEAGDVRRGGQVYLAQCTACHNSDPTKDGPLGPAIKGSSRALLEAKILRGSYPPGYTPKRATSLMPPQPNLEATLSDLAAFLK